MDTFLTYPAEILILFFLIITFFQSGIDKITDWKGNLSFIKDHFKNSPLKNGVPFLLAVVLVLEVAASFLMIFGVYDLLVNGSKEFALYGTILSAVSLLCLLVGQRLAKDYAGAMTLAVYFIITVFGIYLLK